MSVVDNEALNLKNKLFNNKRSTKAASITLWNRIYINTLDFYLFEVFPRWNENST